MTTTIAETYPELFHYTDIVGLKGIITSQTLWATHAAFLNDATEIRLFKERLPEILKPVVADGIAELARIPANQALIVQRGGNQKVVEESATGIATGMFNALLGTQDTPPFVEPFITSFCAATTEQIAQHGLLSQWRSYAKEGGYAIVFDTVGFDLLLKEEAAKWPTNTLFGGDVIYSDDEEKLRLELGQQIEDIKASITPWLRAPQNPAPLENIYPALIQCSCRFKHWGFREENEVRIIAALPGKELFDLQRAHSPTAIAKPRWNFVRGGTPVPCIHLFEEITRLPDKPLPITRIIVGPHQSRDGRRRAIESLLNHYHLDVKISVSEIPYVGH
ncbi:MAG: DUF2971 domain-containing protein [Gammaproteobacteria bacterium]